MMLVAHLQGQEQHSTANATAISTLPRVEGPLAEGVPLSQKFILAVIIHLVLFHPVTVVTWKTSALSLLTVRIGAGINDQKHLRLARMSAKQQGRAKCFEAGQVSIRREQGSSLGPKQ